MSGYTIDDVIRIIESPKFPKRHLDRLADVVKIYNLHRSMRFEKMGYQTVFEIGKGRRSRLCRYSAFVSYHRIDLVLKREGLWGWEIHNGLRSRKALPLEEAKEAARAAFLKFLLKDIRWP